MNSATIICPHCKELFEISDAIRHQMEEELTKAKKEQSETLRKEYAEFTEAKLSQAVQTAVAKERQNAKLELDKVRRFNELEVDKAKKETELETERLRRESSDSKESEKQLRKQLSELLEELSNANKARENAELAARKELLEKEKVIREEAARTASDDCNTKIRERDETINRLREQLTAAKRVAEQGSQQIQGEILELDVEQALRANFPYDTIEEVKKGEKGSDVRQRVNERFYANCGLILWECKAAKAFQPSWLVKLKDEMAEEKAQAGVIVFNPTVGGGDDFKRLSDNVWLVKPRFAVMVGTLLREALVKAFAANRNAEGKDVKIEMIYNYLTGGEFSNRIKYIIESYGEMAKLIDNEKKQAQRRWAAQEKILQKVTGSLYGMSGDLQGIAGMELFALPAAQDDYDDILTNDK